MKMRRPTKEEMELSFAKRKENADPDIWESKRPEGTFASRWSGIPRNYRGLFEKVTRLNAQGKKPGPLACIKAQCLECQGYDRLGVATCTAKGCPLWLLRPASSRTPKDSASQETISD